MNIRKNQITVGICILLTAFFFGTMEISLKLAGVQFDAIQLTFLRFFIGGIILLPFAIIDLIKRKVKLTIHDLIYLLILGIVCICFSMFLYQIGVMRTNAGLAAIIISINPVFTMIFSHFLVSDKFTVKKAIVLALYVIGLVIVANPFSLGEGNDIVGVLIVLVASVAFGLYTALGKKKIAKLGGMAQNSFSFLLGSGILLIIMLFMKSPIISGITLENLSLVLYLGVFVTGVGYYCFVKAIQLSSPSTASIAFFIKPILAIVLAFVILGETITINKIIGVSLVVVGSLINIVKVKKHSIGGK